VAVVIVRAPCGSVRYPPPTARPATHDAPCRPCAPLVHASAATRGSTSRRMSCARPFHRTSGVDPLSDALRAVRVTGAYFYLVEACEPWAVMARASHEVKARVLPEAGLLIPF